MGNFKLILRKGYFKNGHIQKGWMSHHRECSCACNEDGDCVAFGFRDDNNQCYFYVDVSDLNEIVTDPDCNIYIKNSPGNNSLNLSQ